MFTRSPPTTETQWELSVVAGLPAREVRDDVQSSWARSTGAGVSPTLRAAPQELSEDALLTVRRESDWLELAEQVLAPQLPLVRDSGHVLTLFDAQGRMLSARGDPRILDGLQDIHFSPGANWSERVAGTNGPGTALASGRSVHIIGAEHFCAAWHPWHCAATPIHGADDAIIGALDVSGAQQAAQPWSLHFAQLLAGYVEHALRARTAHWREVLFARFAESATRWPDALVAVTDHQGRVLMANPGARARGCPKRVELQAGQVRRSPEVPAWLAQAQVHEVRDEGVRIGACLVGAEARPRSTRRTGRTSPTRYTFEDLLGRTAALNKAVEVALVTAPTNLPVFLLGESGVGKEVLAQSIHSASVRRSGPFIAVNCAALSPELIESELFGYVGGAFSGARAEGRVGRFEAAEGGTLFLDEVGELPPQAQAALLRVLQEGEVTPVGENLPRRVDVRVLAATNRPLEQAVRAGKFRLDLFHRLSVVAITLPPLRERLDDLSQLVAHLAERIKVEQGLSLTLGSGVLDAFRAYAWPGNVRELENVLRRLAVVASGRVATCADLPDSMAVACRGPAPDAEAHRLAAVIDAAPNMTEAAARLGITRSTLYRQLGRLGLKPHRTVKTDEA